MLLRPCSMFSFCETEGIMSVYLFSTALLLAVAALIFRRLVPGPGVDTLLYVSIALAGTLAAGLLALGGAHEARVPHGAPRQAVGQPQGIERTLRGGSGIPRRLTDCLEVRMSDYDNDILVWSERP